MKVNGQSLPNSFRLAIWAGTIFALAVRVEVEAQSNTGCVEPPSGIIAWWPGDGNANDIIGAENGVLSNGVMFITGQVGQAFQFKSSSNQEMFVWSATNLMSSLNLAHAFTIEAWVRFADLNSAHCIICKGLNGSHQYALVTGDIAQNNELELLVESEGQYDGPGSALITSHANLVTNTWYHIAATADGTTKSIYLDGLLLTNNAAASPYTSNSQPVEIGGANVATAAFFNGLIDEVSIYNRALSQTEIQAIYNAGSAGKCKPYIADGPEISAAGTNIVINFLTASNYMYGIQSSTDLLLNSWSTIIDNLPGVGGPTNYMDSGGAMMPRKFYRLFHH